MARNFLCLVGWHDWGEWEYESPTSCIQFQICRRDGAKHPNNRVFHDWSEWEYLASNQCEQARFCKRDQHQEQRIEHSWKYEQISTEKHRRTCTRCNRIEDENHKWLETGTSDEEERMRHHRVRITYYQLYTCEYCEYNARSVIREEEYVDDPR